MQIVKSEIGECDELLCLLRQVRKCSGNLNLGEKVEDAILGARVEWSQRGKELVNIR